MNTEALRRGLRGGFRDALAVELGSCLGDGLWAGLAFVGVGALLTLQFMDLLGSILGFILLGWLAVHGWREASVPVTRPGEMLHEQARLPAFWAGVLLSVVNVGSAAYWVGIGATLLSSHLPVTGPKALLEFGVGYYTELLLWSFAFALVAWQLQMRLPAAAQVLVERGAATLLGILALVSLVSGLRRLHVTAAWLP